MTSTAPTPIGDLDDPLDVLVLARDCQVESDRAQATQFVAAVTWAEQHPPESIDQAATWMSPAGDTGLLLAGEGAPLVAEFCIAEFALAIGRSTDSGRAFIAHSVEVKYRLPKTWTRIMRGDLQVWRARRIAELTLGLSPEAVAFVDAQVAPFAHRIGVAAMERLVEEAIVRFMPELAAERAEKAAEGRHFDIYDEQVSFEGTVRVDGELDLADALDLEEAVSAEAEALRAAGSTQTLDVRRSQALGQISRNQLAFDLNSDDEPVEPSDEGAEPTSVWPKKQRKPRQVVLYIHLSEAAVHGVDGDLHLARVENTRTFVTAEQVKSWCANPDAQVVVKPTIDLADNIHVDAYEAPKRLDEQTGLINHRRVLGSDATPL